MGCYFLLQGNFLTQGSESSVSPALASRFFVTELPGKPKSSGLKQMEANSTRLSSLLRHSVLSYVWLFVIPFTVAHQTLLSMEFSRQEHWSGLLFPPPGDLPYLGIELTSLVLAGRFFTAEPPGNPLLKLVWSKSTMILTPGWGLWGGFMGEAYMKVLWERGGFHCFFLFLLIHSFIECLLYTRYCSRG